MGVLMNCNFQRTCHAGQDSWRQASGDSHQQDGRPDSVLGRKQVAARVCSAGCSTINSVFQIRRVQNKTNSFSEESWFQPQNRYIQLIELFVHQCCIYINIHTLPHIVLLDLMFIPVSGLTGANIKEVAPEEVCPWYRYVSTSDLQ